MGLKKIFLRIRKAYSNIENLDKIIRNKLIIERYSRLAMVSNNKGVSNELIANLPVVISLTTYGHRINDVYLTIESLLNQTSKPNRVLLWLDNSFKKNKIPKVLLNQEKRGLEICYCDDIRSYTKIIPTLEACSDSIIITVDDDIIYTPDFVEHLINAYNDDDSKIYFYRGHKIVFDNRDKIAPYLSWIYKANGSNIYNVPTGVGGVLYPPNCFHKDVTNRKVFLDICPYADDIWLKAMSLLKGVECEKIDTGLEADDKFVYVDTAVSTSLAETNVVQGYNDVQIEKVFQKYEIVSKLKNK